MEPTSRPAGAAPLALGKLPAGLLNALLAELAPAPPELHNDSQPLLNEKTRRLQRVFRWS